MSRQFRFCKTLDCKVRLPDLVYDGHSLCSNCIGKVCTLGNRCSECINWSDELFDSYAKHRHTLELNKLRKAKQRSKAKQSTQLTLVSVDNKVAVSAHSVSPSPPGSIVNVSTNSSISAYSPSAPVKTLPSPTANPSAPSDQVVTRSEFDSLKSLIASMASDLAALRKPVQVGVHSESVPPPTLALPSSSVVDYCDRDPSVNPMLLPLVGGGEVPEGESCPTLACPEAKQESLAFDDNLDRGRKRFRELKDVPSRAKRQRPPSRQCGSSPWPSPDVLHHRSLSARGSPRGTPVDLSTASVPVPLGTGPSRKAEGSFSDSMAANLESLVASCMQRNPKISLPQAVNVAKGYLKINDPHNVSYTSSRSGRGDLGRRDSASALIYVPETPKALDLVSKEGGGRLAGMCHSSRSAH